MNSITMIIFFLNFSCLTFLSIFNQLLKYNRWQHNICDIFRFCFHCVNHISFFFKEKKYRPNRNMSYSTVKTSWGTAMGISLTSVIQPRGEQHEEHLTDDVISRDSEHSKDICTPLCKPLASGIPLKLITSFRLQKSESTCWVETKEPFLKNLISY